MPLDKLKKIALLLIVATIPLARVFNINSYAIALFVVLVLSSIRKATWIRPNGITFLFFGYYFLIALTVSVQQIDAWTTLVKYLPLILLPFSLLYFKGRNLVLNTFVYVILLLCLVSIIYTYISSKGYIYYYHNPTGILDLQTNYLALFACFALAILYYQIILAKKTRLKHYVFIPFLFLSLIVLFNRAALISAVLISLFFMISFLMRTRKIKLMLSFALFLSLVTVWAATRPIVRSKFNEIINIDLGSNPKYTNGVNSRLLTWGCSITQ
ncbi:MAG: hypothetical protein AB3N10_00205, partial [Allomuricauda sp.]